MSPEFLRRFESVVARRPSAIAALSISTPGDSRLSRTARPAPISYGELHRAAITLAAQLRDTHALRSGELIALALPSGARLLTATLATWYAGAACLLLDLKHPPGRRAAILSHARPRFMISETPGAKAHESCQLEAYAVDPYQYARDANASTEAPVIARANAFTEQESERERRLAYVVFTSGSTGTPKGVAISHAGIVPFLNAQIEAFHILTGQRMLATLSPAFDAWFSETGTALLAGATLVYTVDPLQRGPQEFAQLIERHRISHVCLAPALLEHWPAKLMPDCLKTVIIGGEAAPVAGVRDWARKLRVMNVYGPSEATVCTSLWRCDVDYREPFLGEPVPGMVWRVVDPNTADGEELPPEIAGELWLSGPGLATGYWRDASLTAERFVDRAGRRWYRTGDRVVRRSAQGPRQLEFLGRLDRQVQIRGNRVEPLELERCLAEYPGVCEAWVDHAPESATLIAHLAFRSKASIPENARLQEHVRKRLPEYFIPREIHIHGDALPRNANGKLDANLLRSRKGAATRTAHCADSDDLESFQQAPDAKTALARERKLCEIWSSIFGARPRSPGEDFFQAGGSSFDLLRFAAGASMAGIRFSFEAFYREPNIRAVLRQAARETESPGAPDADVSVEALRADTQLDAKTRHRIRRLSGKDTVSSKPGAGSATGFHAASDREPKCIFMTGATGSLGRRLAGEFLQQSAARVLCLVRDVARARKLFAESSLLRDALVSGRIRLVRGDLAQPGLGLSIADRREIVAACDTILHCGARVHLTESYAHLRATNLCGTREILALALAGRAKRLHYISTLGVAVASDQPPGVFYEDDRLTKIQSVYGGYARSKWAAEMLLQNAREAGLQNLRIYRPGYLLETDDQSRDRSFAGKASHKSSQSNSPGLLPEFTAALLRLGVAPHDDAMHDELRLNCTSVAYAARAIAYLSVGSGRAHVPDTAGSSYHLANEYPLYWHEFIQALERYAPGRLRRLPAREFRAQLTRFTHEANPKTELARAAGVALAAVGWRLGPATQGPGNECFRTGDLNALRACDLFAATRRRFDLRNTRNALRESGIDCPPGLQVFEAFLAELTRPALETTRRTRP